MERQRDSARPRGESISASDQADWNALEDAPANDIVAGKASSPTAGTSPSLAVMKKNLERGIAGARNAMSQVGMEGQILYCQQAEALMTNVLPLGLGMK